MRTFFAIALMMLVVVGMVRIFGSLLTLRPWRWNRAVRSVGQRYAAAVRAASWFMPPSMAFMYGRVKCQLRYRARRRRNGGRCTELACAFPDTRTRIEIVRSGHNARLRAVRPIEIGPEFDHRFSVFAAHSDAAHKLLSNGVQWQVEQLARHLGTDQVRIALSGGRLLISKSGYIRELEPLDDFVRFGLELLDQAMLTRTTGISFVDELSPALLERVVCPICSEEIRRDMVVCLRCKTPHCRDCWEYNGQCAMFACGETRFAVTSAGC